VAEALKHKHRKHKRGGAWVQISNPGSAWDDYVGWSPDAVTYYRQNPGANLIANGYCGAQVSQDVLMVVDWSTLPMGVGFNTNYWGAGGWSAVVYKTNVHWIQINDSQAYTYYDGKNRTAFGTTFDWNVATERGFNNHEVFWPILDPPTVSQPSVGGGTLTSTSATFSLTNTVTNGSDANGYSVYRWDGNSNFASFEIGSLTATWVDTTLTSNLDYSYCIHAANDIDGWGTGMVPTSGPCPNPLVYIHTP